MKSLGVTKIVKEIEFEGVWCELKAKKCFQRQSFTGYSGLTLVFVWGGALRGVGSFLFFGGFLLVLAEFSFWRGGWGRGYHSMGFGYFPDVS